MKITYNMVTTHVGNNDTSTFASDIGLKPGEFPAVLYTDLGNGESLHYLIHDVHDGDLQWVKYKQTGSDLTLTVFND